MKFGRSCFGFWFEKTVLLVRQYVCNLFFCVQFTFQLTCVVLILKELLNYGCYDRLDAWRGRASTAAGPSRGVLAPVGGPLDREPPHSLGGLPPRRVQGVADDAPAAVRVPDQDRHVSRAYARTYHSATTTSIHNNDNKNSSNASNNNRNKHRSTATATTQHGGRNNSNTNHTTVATSRQYAPTALKTPAATEATPTPTATTTATITETPTTATPKSNKHSNINNSNTNHTTPNNNNSDSSNTHNNSNNHSNNSSNSSSSITDSSNNNISNTLQDSQPPRPELAHHHWPDQGGC